jgi:hypothetical protein
MHEGAGIVSVQQRNGCWQLSRENTQLVASPVTGQLHPRVDIIVLSSNRRSGLSPAISLTHIKSSQGTADGPLEDK